MKLKPDANRLRDSVWNVGPYISMLFAKEHGPQSARLKLKKGFYAGSHAISAKVYRFVRGIERHLGLVHDRTMSVLMQFILIKICRFFFHFSQLLFEITFAIGQRRLLLLECKALALDVKHPVVHITDDFHD